MDLVFVTHNELGRACLEELYAQGATIRAVFTRPDRDHISDQIDLSSFTAERNIPLHRVESVNDSDVEDWIRSYGPDFLFVVGWSQLVEPSVLSIPSVAALGMHPAPLPRGRGRAPIAWTLIKGLDETALSLFHLVEEADAGDLVGQKAITVRLHDDAASLFEKVVATGRELIREHYGALAAKTVPSRTQSTSEATWWPRRRPEHGLVDWTRSPMAVYNWIRGQSDPYPGAFSYLDYRKVTFWDANPPGDDRDFVKPGEITYVEADAVGIGAWENTIEVTCLQVTGDDRIAGSELINRYDIGIGDTFEAARDRIQDPS
jgi:methionyl-tRNA formyltransferase